MSWIHFQIGQPKKQIIPQTVERDFKREHEKLQLEAQIKRLQKSPIADLAKSAVKENILRCLLQCLL